MTAKLVGARQGEHSARILKSVPGVTGNESGEWVTGVTVFCYVDVRILTATVCIEPVADVNTIYLFDLI